MRTRIWVLFHSIVQLCYEDLWSKILTCHINVHSFNINVHSLTGFQNGTDYLVEPMRKICVQIISLIKSIVDFGSKMEQNTFISPTVIFKDLPLEMIFG